MGTVTSDGAPEALTRGSRNHATDIPRAGPYARGDAAPRPGAAPPPPARVDRGYRQPIKPS